MTAGLVGLVAATAWAWQAEIPGGPFHGSQATNWIEVAETIGGNSEGTID